MITMKHDKRKWYPCIPGAIEVICIFISFVFFLLFLVFKCIDENQLYPALFFCVYTMCTIAFILWSWKRNMSIVQIRENYIICRIPFYPDIILPYNECSVGMSYHIHRGSRVWWVYLYSGNDPLYSSAKAPTQINTLVCKADFVRIQYRKEVYDALIAVLPKDKRTSLASMRRCARLDD